MTAESFLTILPLAIPAAVLVTLLAILLTSIRRRRRATSAANHLIIETRMQRNANRKSNELPCAGSGASAPQVRETPVLQPVVAPVAPTAAAPVGKQATPEVSTLHAHAPDATSGPATPAPAAAPAPTVSASVLVERIALKEAEGVSDGLAQLYLDLARAYRGEGRQQDALQALQSAAGLGAMHGPKSVHALARLELGEVALSAGDRIGACEQWQMAKMAFHEDGLRDAYALTDKRMRDNGCPTDWVLTEF